ncbi:uncharacterized protein (DUF1501 family) [Granulicella aggregans]|uniref:Uncharacterized protein (DUF1501 family) n=1 Tax=Granulicella aggregans TaxID=474949 RepID=A0A7W7ZCD0_9BACT|nr:DUF1501 domain-containing protein [Granulicella aggregans]MBB5057162.1 uncharacterized protein (DUF1501 family) [Granulicella aggregans]
MHIQRRSFLRYISLAAAGSAAGIGPFGALNAFAQSTSSDYKALVCIQLDGGNDGNNLLVPTDSAGYQNYAKLRGPLSLAQGSLLPMNGLSYGMNGNLPGIQSLFNSGHAAVLANVGTLVAPTTRQQYISGTAVTPHNLFSHIDQETLWQNSAQNVTSSTGWGGRIADLLQGGNSAAKYPVVTSVTGSHVFCNGVSTSYASVIPGNTGNVLCTEKSGCDIRLQAAQDLLTFNSGLTLVQADDTLTQNAYNYSKVLQDAVSSAQPISTVFPTGPVTSLAAQLKQIAQIIQVRSALGTGRQIFFATQTGYDLHADQVSLHPSLLQDMNAAISAFYQATVELGVSEQVTTFTTSDFGRALQPNSATGSDHAWGGHHIIVGGAVKGGKLYGTYPTLALGGPDDAGVNGRWIPTTSVAQYAATLASWFGVADGNLNSVLPTLENFQTRNLGFI